MKEILMMMQATCPYCKMADRLIEELQAENPAYRNLTIRRVDENREPAYADTLDYYYVPTFYADGEKLMEGVPSKDKIRAVLDRALLK